MLPIVALLGAALAAPAAAQTADLVLENAVIYTVNRQQPRARAVAIKDGLILAVGGDVSKHMGAATKRLDMRGAAVYPGFIDAHGHMRGLGALLESRDLRHVPSVAAIAALVRDEASKRKPGEWILMRNWDQTNWGGQFPKARDLDAAAPRNPVFLSRVDGHAGWANSKALELAGVTRETPDPSGGKIIRDADGNPAGVFIDNAQGLVRAKIPPAPFEQIKRQLALAAAECARLGLTGVHDAGVTAADLRAYRELISENRLPVRVNAMIGGEGGLWREYLAKGPEISPKLAVRSIKLMIDGALGSRGAALWQPYSDDKGNTGLLMLAKEDVERVARQAAAKGFQVCTHAIGDKANRIVLDAYAAALGGRNDKRFRIEHAQIISLPDFKLFQENSVIASMQATHATSDMRWAERRLGPDRIAGAYAWRRFLSLGVPVANGSDFPVEEANPILGFHASFTRQDAQGNPPEGWTADQRLTRAESLESWTLTPAYAAFEEREKGTLEPGKLADLVVLDRDIMTVPPGDVLKAKVVMTMLGGEIVHEAK